MKLARLQAAIAPLREALLKHPLYQDLHGPVPLRIFMEYHIFAVWDFMSLLKILQQRICCVSLPWIPTESATNSRFINEIVLGEESDEDGHGGYASHFELYHRAMTQFGANTSQIDRFLQALRQSQSVADALRSIEVAPPIQAFVLRTFEFVESNDLCQIASAFTFGREDLLPDVFQRIVDEISEQVGFGLDDFQFYLNRHIELDGDSHGPMSERLIKSLCGDDDARWDAAQRAAMAALQARLALWDAIHAAIQKNQAP